MSDANGFIRPIGTASCQSRAAWASNWPMKNLIGASKASTSIPHLRTACLSRRVSRVRGPTASGSPTSTGHQCSRLACAGQPLEPAHRCSEHLCQRCGAEQLFGLRQHELSRHEVELESAPWLWRAGRSIRIVLQCRSEYRTVDGRPLRPRDHAGNVTRQRPGTPGHLRWSQSRPRRC